MNFIVGYSPHTDETCGIELGCLLARSAGRSVEALTVVPRGWPTAGAGDTDRDFKLWAAQEGARCASEAERILAQHPDVPSSARWASGRSVPQTLLEHAERVEASLVVLGSGRSGPYGAITLTSKTERVLHSSPVPVAVAPRGFRAPSPARVARASIAFRGDDPTWTLLERAAALCTAIGVSLRVVTFAVRGRAMYPTHGVTGAEEMVLKQWIAQAEKAQAEAVEYLYSQGLDSSQVSAEVAVGTSWGAAFDQLDWGPEDVLVVGSSASSGVISRVFLGSSASKIVRKSPVPVLVVP
ncbi:MAG: universal stress protein [Actinomycetales bacterium]